MIVRDEGPTAVMPQVAPARPPGMARRLLPWIGVGAAAVAVIGGTTVWSAGLRSDAVPEVPVVVASIPAAPPTTTTAPVPTPTPERTLARVVEEAPATRHVAPPATVRPTTAAPTTTTTTAVTTTTSAARGRFGTAATTDPYGYFSDLTDTAAAGN